MSNKIDCFTKVVVSEKSKSVDMSQSRNGIFFTKIIAKRFLHTIILTLGVEITRYRTCSGPAEIISL